MSERHHEHQERHEQAHHELEQARREKLEELRHNVEAQPDNSKERAEAAREIIHKHEPVPEEPVATPEDQAPKSRLPFLDHKLNYTETLASVQRRLTPVSRSFSKVIHTPAIDKTSEALEKTIARPSVTLGATWTALIVGGLFYLIARRYGYMLSGSELLFSFLVGALIGLALEGVWRALRRH
jgi:hypothetical protein